MRRPTTPTWGERVQKTLEHEPEYQAERLVLQVNGELRRRMEELGVTQAQLAARLGVSQAHVSKLLNYRNLTLRSLAMLAHALDSEWTDFRLGPRAADSRHARFARPGVAHQAGATPESANTLRTDSRQESSTSRTRSPAQRAICAMANRAPSTVAN